MQMDVGITDKMMQDIDAGMKSVKDAMPTEFKGTPSFVVGAFKHHPVHTSL